MHQDFERILGHFKERHAMLFAEPIEITWSLEGGAESFTLDVRKNDSSIAAHITTLGASGFRYALNALHDWLEGQRVDASISDGPDFAIRGVIEGFYGLPWSHENRKEVIASIADANMNTFMIAPKDSPWQRFKWREPFAPKFLEKVKELVEVGLDHGVQVSVCVSPGLNVAYSSQSDRSAVMVRYQQLYELGVRHFGLLWDDIDWELRNYADIATYSSTAQAHIEFSNQIYHELKALDDSCILTVCPTHYCGRGNEPYLIELGKGLNVDINLFWTGRQICSEYLEICDAKIFIESTKRPPLYWDNFPVNDGSMRHSLHIGPVQSREVGLEAFSRGLLSNPMTQALMSMLPVRTIGDYLWDTSEYNPYDSWERALRRMVPKESDLAALRALLRCTMGTCTGGDPAPDLRKVFNEGTNLRRSGDLTNAARVFREYGHSLLDALETLESKDFSRRDLIAEIIPWIVKARVGANVIIQFGDVVAQCTFDEDEKMLNISPELLPILESMQNQLDESRTRMFGEHLDGYIWELAAEIGGAEEN